MVGLWRSLVNVWHGGVDDSRPCWECAHGQGEEGRCGHPRNVPAIDTLPRLNGEMRHTSGLCGPGGLLFEGLDGDV